VDGDRIVTIGQHVVAPVAYPGASHRRNTSRIRFCAFSYSMAEPCWRSDQVIMYFIASFFILLAERTSA
jgi:hypothetical protein